jgi:hypothetical protein
MALAVAGAYLAEGAWEDGSWADLQTVQDLGLAEVDAFVAQPVLVVGVVLGMLFLARVVVEAVPGKLLLSRTVVAWGRWSFD